MTTSNSRKWLALVAIGLAMMAVGLDMTVLNTALPTLARDLDANTGQLQWLVDGYNLVLAAAILPAGLFGDRLGRRRMLLGGLIVFGVGSAWCALASSAGELIAARTVLGLGAAAIMPLAISMLAVLFESHERPRAIATMTAFNMIGIPLGPIIAGAILQHFAWGWVFAINLPLTLVALIAMLTLMPETHGARGSGIDLKGITVSSLGLVGLTYGLIEASSHPWTSVQVLGPLAVGVALLALLVILERRVRHPLLDLSLFTTRSFTSGTVLATVVSFAMFGVMFVLPQLFQAVQGADALGTGLRMLPLVAGLIAGFQLGNRATRWPGALPTVTTGFAVMAVASALGTLTGTHTGFGFVAVWSALLGLGVGLSLPTAMSFALDALSPQRAGMGSSMIMALRQTGAVLGVAILGSTLSAGYHAALPPGAGAAVRSSAAAGTAVANRTNSPALLEQVREAFTAGMGTTLWVCAAVAALGIVLALLMRDRRPETPRREEQPETAGHA